MKILLVHNFYQQAGGEDRVFTDEAELLASRGHSVLTFTKHNDDVTGMRPWTLAARTVWNQQSTSQLEQLAREARVDIVHFHNTLPLISPAGYYAARRAGAAVVQTLHNYRLVCPKATLFRDGAPCERCLGRIVPWPAIQHACYRDSRAATTAIATMLTFHRTVGTYRRVVDAYIALSQFSREKLIEGGLPGEKMHLRPNFMLNDPGFGAGDGGFAMYLGRLSVEKGIHTLLDAWQRHQPGLRLLICGNGPLESLVQEAAARNETITWLPNRPHSELLHRLGKASLLVLPSLWYEGFPKTIVEAYAKGTPVVASKLGSMNEIVHDAVSGTVFEPGDAADLAEAVCRTIRDRGRLARMRLAARQLFETKYTAAVGYVRLLEVYEHALRVRHGATKPIHHDTEPSITRSVTLEDSSVASRANEREEAWTT